VAPPHDELLTSLPVSMPVSLLPLVAAGDVAEEGGVTLDSTAAMKPPPPRS